METVEVQSQPQLQRRLDQSSPLKGSLPKRDKSQAPKESKEPLVLQKSLSKDPKETPLKMRKKNTKRSLNSERKKNNGMQTFDLPPAFQGGTIESFNNAVKTINELINITIKNKGQQYTNMPKIVKLARKLGFPSEFCKKQPRDVMQFIMTKEFISMIKFHMHQVMNNLIFHQFNCQNSKIQPYLIKNVIFHLTCHGSQNSPVFYRFYTDNTGNNHVVVRQVLKRRPWLQRLESLKSATKTQFEATNFFWTQWKRSKLVVRLDRSQIYCKIDGNYILTNKANLLITMQNYYKQTNKTPPCILPESYNLRSSQKMDKEFYKIRDNVAMNTEIWIVKPGEYSNRGNGIKVMRNLLDVKYHVSNGNPGDTWVVQKYIERPLLVGGVNWFGTPYRKFDIRVFGLAQIIGTTQFRGYFYNEGYIRTTSFKYSNANLNDRDIHLTNDAVQLHCPEYGKYEPGNKISFKDFETFLRNEKYVEFKDVVLPKIKDTIRDTLIALWQKLQTLQETTQMKSILNQFELFGYDFMIDEDVNVYFIEVNTNPCLDTSPCPLLNRLITQMLDQTFKITVDPFLRGKDSQYSSAQEMTISEINYEMIYSSTNEKQQALMSQEAPTDDTSGKMKSKKFNRNDIQNDVMLMDPDEPSFTPLDDHGLDYKFSPYQM